MKIIKEILKLKYCFVIISLLIIILFFFIKSEKGITNNPKKEQKTLNNHIFGRELDFHDDSIKVCSKSSENLVKYFKTGSIQYVEFHSEEDPGNPPNYIKTLLEAISFDNDLEGEQRTDKAVSYLMHFSPIFFFYLVGLACIPGWIVCICMSIYRCCCCSCCKKPECRLPFFVVVSVMNLAVIITCIVGLGKTNKIFKGVVNTECSFLRFINEVVDGESKNTLPKWGGIEGILHILNRTSVEIEIMSSDDTDDYLEEKMNAYKEAMSDLESSLERACEEIAGESNYQYNDYILDIVKEFGKYENGIFTNNSYADKWMKLAGITDKVEKSYNAYGKVIHGNTYEAMILAQYFIEFIEENIYLIKLIIGESILILSDTIDKYGRLIFNIIFSVLLCFSFLLEFLLIFLYFFSSRKYHNCIMHFIIKYLIHILWNVFALLMIAIFIFGTTLTLIGTFGEDLVDIISYIFSSKNLKSQSPILLGEDGYLLEVCMNGKGNVWDTLGIESSLSDIDRLRMLSFEIDFMIEMLTVNHINYDDDPVYEELITEIDRRKNLEKNFGLIGQNSDDDIIRLNDTILQLNNALRDCSIGERLSISCNVDFPDKLEGDCNSVITDNKCINPSNCYIELNNRYSSSTCSNANNLGNIIYSIFNAINYASAESDDKPNSLKNKGSAVHNDYGLFLLNASIALDEYTVTFAPLTSLFNNFVGNGSIFGFLNCAFLGKNAKVLLYYLNSAIGTEFKSLGITVIVIGFAMSLSISFTIVLTMIISATVRIRANERNLSVTTAINNNNDINTNNNAMNGEQIIENNNANNGQQVDKNNNTMNNEQIDKDYNAMNGEQIDENKNNYPNKKSDSLNIKSN